MTHRQSSLTGNHQHSVNLRGQIANWVAQVIYQGQSANLVTQHIAEQVSDPRNRALARECLFGVCRQFEQLNWALSQLLQKPLKKNQWSLQSLLLSSLYQLLYLNNAEHAVISESVNACRQLEKDWAAKLVNGVLRNAIRRKSSLLEHENTPDSVQHSMPEWLLKRFKNAWPKYWQSICQQSNQKAPLTLRINRSHANADKAESLLKLANIEFTPHPVANDALILAIARNVQDIPEFSGGLFSVQDTSAQLAAELLPINPGERVLDACAAPGGKTAHLLEMHPKLSLTSLEIDATRADKIHQNLQRLNLSAQVIIDDAQTFSEQQPFDAILLDAPCSATGVIRRQPDIKQHRRDQDIWPLVQLQNAILTNLWQQLKPGGYLLYATCSILPDENQKQIKKFLKQQPNATTVALPDAVLKMGTDTGFGLQLFPQLEHDGFFYCLLKKSPN